MTTTSQCAPTPTLSLDFLHGQSLMLQVFMSKCGHWTLLCSPFNEIIPSCSVVLCAHVVFPCFSCCFALKKNTARSQDHWPGSRRGPDMCGHFHLSIPAHHLAESTSKGTDLANIVPPGNWCPPQMFWGTQLLKKYFWSTIYSPSVEFGIFGLSCVILVRCLF